MENSVPQLNPESEPAKKAHGSPAEQLSTPESGAAGTTGTTAHAAAATEKAPAPPIGDYQKPNGSEAMPAAGHVPPGATTARAQLNKHAAATDAEKFFSLQQRFPLQVFEHESRWQKLGLLGPTFTGLASLVLTLFVWSNSSRLSREQNELQNSLQERQTQLQEKQVQAELSDIRFRFLNDLTAKEETKKVYAEIGLAGHGLAALPVVYFALGVEVEQIRSSAVKVFYRMFQASSSFAERDALLSELMKQMMSPNQNLRIGIVQSLVQVEPLLDPSERKKVITFLEDKVPPQNVCRQSEGRSMVKEAATFFRAGDANSIPYLLSVAKTPECGDGWMQAMVKLADVGAKQPQRRGELLMMINQIRPQALNGLKERIGDETLREGGFSEFLKPGQVEVTFTDFEQKVAAEFEELRKSLSEQ